MLACWKAEPSERPQFSELVQIIPEVVKYMEGYDRSQLHAGYERVSSRCCLLSFVPSPPVLGYFWVVSNFDFDHNLGVFL